MFVAQFDRKKPIEATCVASSGSPLRNLTLRERRGAADTHSFLHPLCTDWPDPERVVTEFAAIADAGPRQ